MKYLLISFLLLFFIGTLSVSAAVYDNPDYRFGIYENGYYLTIASHGERGQLDPEDFVEMGYTFPLDTFTVITHDTLKYSTYDRIGDTVIVLLDGLQHKFTYASFGYYHTRNWCYDELFVRLEPLETPPTPQEHQKFLIIQDKPSITDTIISFTSIRISDPVISKAVRSCGDFLLSSWQDTTYFNPAYRNYTDSPVDGNEFPPLNKMVMYNPVVPSNNPDPDTILVPVHGFYGKSVRVYGTWFALFRLTRDNGVWKQELLMPPHFEDKQFILLYSIDLDNDGNREYVVQHEQSISLYRLTGSEFKKIDDQIFSGC